MRRDKNAPRGARFSGDDERGEEPRDHFSPSQRVNDSLRVLFLAERVFMHIRNVKKMTPSSANRVMDELVELVELYNNYRKSTSD